MFTCKGLINLCVTAWLLVDVETYKSGCDGGYCFVITDISNASEFLYQSNAQQWCQRNGTQLVEIRNQSIQNSLINFIKGADNLGLNGWNVMTNGKRSSGGPCLRLNGNNIGDLTIADQEDTSNAYVYLKSTNSGFGLFASRPTVNKGGFICTGLSNCSGGVTISGQCYKSFSETLSWYEARNRCLIGGGDLATLDTITTNAGLNALNGSWINASNVYWIGIRREWWKWQGSVNSPGSDVKYSEWMTGQPSSGSNTECLCLSTSQWKWITCDCNQQSGLPFVCITDNKSTTPTSTPTTAKTSTTTTPNIAWTTTSTTTRSTITTPSVASESGGVSSPTFPSTVTANSTTAGNETGIMDQSMGLNRETTIGIGVGVGAGGALIIISVVVIVMIFCRKRCPLREALLSLKTYQKKQIEQPVGGDLRELGGMTEDPYESLQQRIERAADGLYQSLDRTKKTDSSVISSNI